MKPKLLLISAIDPQIQNSGGATRIKHTYNELSKYFQIDLLTFSKDTFPLEPKTLFSKIPYWFSPWYNKKLIQQIKEHVSSVKYDLIEVEFSQLLYLVNYLPKEIPKFFVAHDISFVSFYRRIFDDKTSIFKKIIRYVFFLQIYFYEKKYPPKFDKIIAVSQNDQELLKKFFPKKDIICIPNGIDKIDFLRKEKNEKVLNLGYIGSFSHTPNLNAVKYFFEHISPILVHNKIEYKFYLAGDNNPKIIKYNFNDKNLINLGLVKKTKDFYQKIDCLITPIFSGSGSRIKILEALSFGVPVVSSKIGAEGINLKTPYLQIANTPEEYIELLNNLPKNNLADLKKQLEPLLWKNVFSIYNTLSI